MNKKALLTQYSDVEGMSMIKGGGYWLKVKTGYKKPLRTSLKAIK